MHHRQPTSESSPDRGLLYIGVVACLYLLSLSSYLFEGPAFHPGPPSSIHWNSLYVGAASLRVGLIYGALILMAIWVCCGRGSWLIRFLTVSILALAGTWWLGIFTIRTRGIAALPLTPALVGSGIICFHFLLLCIFAWAARKLFGWPAPSREAIPSESGESQFPLRDLFLLITAGSMALATFATFRNDLSLHANDFHRVLFAAASYAALHTLAQIPMLLIAGFAIYAAADPRRSLMRSGDTFAFFAAIGVIWIAFEGSTHRFPSTVPTWAFILPGVFGYHWTVCGGLLAAREFGWLEVTDGWEREKPVP